MSNICVGSNNGILCGNMTTERYCPLHAHQTDSHNPLDEIPIWQIIGADGNVLLFDITKLPKKVVEEGPVSFQSFHTFTSLFYPGEEHGDENFSPLDDPKWDASRLDLREGVNIPLYGEEFPLNWRIVRIFWCVDL